MTARHSVRPSRPGQPRRPGRGLWRVLSPGPDEVGWRTVAVAVLSGAVVACLGAALLSGLAGVVLPEVAATARTGLLLSGLEPPGVALSVVAGWVLVVVGAAGPALWLGARLVEALVALESARASERRLARDVAAQDQQLARLAERLAVAAGARARSAEEVTRAQWAVDQARTDLAHARDELRQLRQSLDVARLDLVAALGSRDDALAAAQEAARQAQVSAEVARQAEQALALLALRQGERVPAAAAGADIETGEAVSDDGEALGAAGTAGDGAGSPADVPVVPAWVRDPADGRLASFSSVDLRVFDAFAEAGLDDVAAVLDAPAGKGRHSARPTLDPASSEDPTGRREPEAPAAGRAAVASSPAATPATAAAEPREAAEEDGREVA